MQEFAVCSICLNNLRENLKYLIICGTDIPVCNRLESDIGDKLDNIIVYEQ